MSESDQYLKHFPVGLKVNVAIPVPDGNTFHDWAVIHSIDEDLVSLQLSRDKLPAGVKLTVGTIFDIRTGNESTGYSCRAIIVAEGFQNEILLRFIGEIVSTEAREFYRIDAFLPIKYFISSEQNSKKLKEIWQAKRAARIAERQEKKEAAEKPWQRLQAEQRHETLPAAELLEEKSLQLNEADSGQTKVEQAIDWDNLIPIAANISGGGVRFLIHHKFEADALVPLEIYLPSDSEPYVIDAVGVVAFVGENFAASKQSGRIQYNTGLKFTFVDERDRDAIVSYISNVQLKRIRQMREQYLFRSPSGKTDQATSGNSTLKIIKTAFLALFAVVMLAVILSYFKGYAENRPKNAIQIIFDQGFSEYLKKIGRTPTD